MQLLRAIFINILTVFTPAVTFAHETGMAHEEAIPTINPVFAVVVVAALLFGLFALWKFILKK